MTGDQKRGAVLFGSLVGLGLASASLEIALQIAIGTPSLFPVLSLPILLAAIPGGFVFMLRGWRRGVMGLVTAGVASCSAGLVLGVFVLGSSAFTAPLVAASFLGGIGSVWLANAFAAGQQREGVRAV